MNTLDIMLNLSLLALMVLTQIGERPLNRWTYLRPALLTVAVAGFFLGSVPTQGNDLYLYAIAVVGGALLGLVALGLMRLDWDAQGRRLTARAGLAYAAVWVGVIGGRMLFAELATHGWAQQVGRFSYEHQITGADAWRAAFVLMALSMIAARTLGLAVRAALTRTRRALA